MAANYYICSLNAFYTMSVLIQFSVGNFRSFNQERTFTFEPTSIKDKPIESIFCEGKQKLSTVSAIYGANSSGKSNLIQAIQTMGELLVSSVKLNDGDRLPYSPFMLSTASGTRPMHFEIVYTDDDNAQVRYGFENDNRFIIREWLFIKAGTSIEKTMFLRDNEGIAVDDINFPEGKGLEERTNDNRLFLSLAAQLGGSISKSILSFFQSELNILSGIDSKRYSEYTKRLFFDGAPESNEALHFFKYLGLGFTDVNVEELVYVTRTPGVEPKSRLETFSKHHIYDEDGTVVGKHIFRFEGNESQGTQKIFELAGPIFNVLKNGGILLVDELDAKMHPLISQQIVRLFTNPDANPRHAQLLFTTHDTNLLSAGLLRRDQIWFTEKDSVESTDLYRLTDIHLPDGTKPRGDGNLERNYIRGRYGAIPFFHYS